MGYINSLVARIGRSKGAQNFGWLVVDRGVRLAVGIGIGSWVARYLGKQDFGLLNYSMALVAIFATLTPLGMDALVVREIIRDPKQGGRWIGTVLGFRTGVAVFASIFALVSVYFLRPNEPRIWVVVAILAVGTIFQSLESGELWFQAHTRMRRLIVPRMMLFLVMNVLKVVAVLRGVGVAWFSGLTTLEQVVSGGLTWFAVRRSLGSENSLSFEYRLGMQLLRECWPLALATLAGILYMKLAQIILGSLMGDAASGVFAAAIRIPDVALFLPTVLASSMLPSLLRSKAEGIEAYQTALRRYFRINAIMAYCICVPISAGSYWIIHLLFGASFHEASPVLAVYVWSLLFVYIGVARGQYLLNEKDTIMPFVFSVLGLVVNLVACFLLIPRFGVMGAAVVTLLSHLISAFLSSFVFARTRSVGREQLLAILTPWRIRVVTQP